MTAAVLPLPDSLNRAELAAIIRQHINRPKDFYLRTMFVQERI